MSNEAVNEKIKCLDDLAEMIAAFKEQGKVVVHCHGVFDLVHPGHIRHFEDAKRQGDILVVTVTPDEYVNKGPGRPVFNQRLRAESLAALQAISRLPLITKLWIGHWLRHRRFQPSGARLCPWLTQSTCHCTSPQETTNLRRQSAIVVAGRSGVQFHRAPAPATVWPV